MQRQWLITGGAGFIGRRLLQTLVAKQQKVRVIDNFSATTKDMLAQQCAYTEKGSMQLSEEIAGQVELIVGDIQDAKLAHHICQGMDVIVHLAANTGVRPSLLEPRRDFLHNALGTFNYLEAARLAKVPRFIFASSGAVFGAAEPPFHEQHVTAPISPYGASKLTGEAYCSAYYHSFGIETVALRFSNVYGPLSTHKESVVAKFISQIMRQEQLEVYGNGEQTRDFIYVDDIVAAIIAAAHKTHVGGQIYQIATNKETTVNELCQLLFPLLQAYGFAMPTVVKTSPRVGDSKRNYADTRKAKEELGWQDNMSLAQGLKVTVDWLVANTK